tara:strand:+ start:2326 stop:2928 length:603 start_codon:yes stop_codon:yes gene_type:complete
MLDYNNLTSIIKKSPFFTRVIDTLLLRSRVYAEAEIYSSALLQALLIPFLIAIIRGITVTGYNPDNVIESYNSINDLWIFLIGVIAQMTVWILWTFGCYFIGINLLSTSSKHASFGELVRATGFAQTPNLVILLGLLPFFDLNTMLLIGTIWWFMAMMVAIKFVLNYDSLYNTFFLTLAGFLVVPLILWPGYELILKFLL